MYSKTINSYICLSVGDCKRLGYLNKDSIASGVIKWTQGNRQVAAVRITTNTGAIPCAVLNYVYKGREIETPITLRFKASNLNNGTGYYYFVCPETGLSCRKLYLVNGKFISRRAFNPLYESQTEAKSIRRGAAGLMKILAELDEMEAQRYRRLTYRGKPTPFGRRYDKLTERLEDIHAGIFARVEAKGWGAI